MIIEQLSVTDFRVFQGTHKFDLRPRVKYEKQRPIILYGGLNGAGKTTTLTAVRLALYGKHSLGHGVSQKSYDQFLKDSIHRNKKSLLTANSSKIDLTFTYTTLGLEKTYQITREWIVENNKVHESICIYENNKELSELNNEQCQAFLNELIPIGVSDLFFFDGEKIADLAEDTGGKALGEAIKKLLGLDIIDTLTADLNILARSLLKKNSSNDVRKRMEDLEINLNETEYAAELLLREYEVINTIVVELQTSASKIEQELSTKGGAWASSREDELKRQAHLSAEKSEIENRIREIFYTNYPLSIAPEFLIKTGQNLRDENKIKSSNMISSVMKKELSTLNQCISDNLKKHEAKLIEDIINEKFSKYINSKNVTTFHDISDSTFYNFQKTTEDAIKQKKPELYQLKERLKNISLAIDNAGKNIARAPEENSIKPYIKRLNSIREELNKNISKKTKILETYKRKLREAIDITRMLDNLSQEIKTSEDIDRSSRLIFSIKDTLQEFSSVIANKKIKDLEQEFIHSFNKLARKEDINLKARINSENFSVTLVDNHENKIKKDELSAGEKQIYAIAILEALARTSGRHLPIIIDTPLGRLDSIHREKLINRYFPTASHQVIILSTDTEVDENFYNDLSQSISHAYKLNYDPASASTVAKEGYFWRKPAKEY